MAKCPDLKLSRVRIKAQGISIISLAFIVNIGLAACSAYRPTIQSAPTVMSDPTLPMPITTPSQEINSLPPLPTSTALPTPDNPSPIISPTVTTSGCWGIAGEFEIGQLETDLLNYPLEFRVYLPPCYSDLPEAAYPVLYLVHGQTSTDDQWQRIGVGAVADTLISTGELPSFLIVLPRDRVWREPTDDNFGQALVEVLIPWIDAHYRTLPAREYRAIGGLSRGGAWALHLGLTHPELFSAVGMHSGFAFHSDVPTIRSRMDAIPLELMPHFYLDLGDNDRPEITESAIWFEGLLTEYNIPHEWHMFPGYHEEAYWQAHLAQYLSWYAQDWFHEP